MAATTPVGYLYTPQQLAGSLRYGSGVRLGNWREDDEIDDKRMADYIASKEAGDLAVLKKSATLGPQLAPVALSTAPADGIMRFGDTVLVQSKCNDGTLAVSLGQTLVCDDAKLFGVFACPPTAGPVARNAITFASYDGIAPGQPIVYGQKVLLEFSDALAVKGFLCSFRSGRTQLSTQLIAKQEVFMHGVDVADGSGFSQTSSPYDCAWTIHPTSIDDRIIAQGTPVAAGEPFVLVHCMTNKRLASIGISLPTDFGQEGAVCAHTYHDTGKVNKLMRETMGRPTNNLISREETSENHFGVLYAA